MHNPSHGATNGAPPAVRARLAPDAGLLAPPTGEVPRYSVVVPVFNEADNIGPFCRQALAELPPGYELLVCYDNDDDNTLPALAALPASEKPSIVRPIKNDLGRGVRYAIEAGMRAARAPVVVVTMADLSDDFAKVNDMVHRIEAGADVVCASRYVRGGKQVGGPRLKGLLSRVAGLSLHWLTGLPTHDPTNSFKAYRKDFLNRTPIESTAGFCLGLELTAKAHFQGGRVEEVPASWHDRSAGTSRFRLFNWLPHYLRWYFWAFYQRYRTALAVGLTAVMAVVLFLSNILFSFVDVATSTGLEASWNLALNHAFREHWRIGVDYVFTYGPLGFLMTVTYDPVMYPWRMAWELFSAALTSALCLGILWRLPSWKSRAVMALVFTLLGPTFVVFALESKFVFLMAAVCLPLLYRPKPSLIAAALAINFITIVALTKATYAAIGVGLTAALLAVVATSRGWRQAAALAVWSLVFFVALWVGMGQALADLPSFCRTALDVASSYSEGMSQVGPLTELIVALFLGGLWIIGSALRAQPGQSWTARLAPIAATAWIFFGLFKVFFVRHENARVEAFCWSAAALPFLLWPAANARGWRPGLLRATLSLSVGMGIYGVMQSPVLANKRWNHPVVWARQMVLTVKTLGRFAEHQRHLNRSYQTTAAGAALPKLDAIIGKGSVDLLNFQQGAVMLNGWHWTPRPMFQSYSAHAPALQRMNRDFFRSDRAPDYVLLAGGTVDCRLPTLDDGPAFLEVLCRYEPRETEKDYLLMSRRTGEVPEVVGAPLHERTVRLGEAIDLKSLGDGAKAISFGIDYRPLGKLQKLVYKPPQVGLEVTFEQGGFVLYRIIPGMIHDPILIDPLPRDRNELFEFVTKGKSPRVTSVRLVPLQPERRREIAEPVTCTVWSLNEPKR